MAVLDLHYIWALGHAITVACSCTYPSIPFQFRETDQILAFIIFRTVLFRSIPLTIYKLLYTGTLVSYAIVCYKAYGVPRADVAFIRKAFVDENVQYALLAFWW
jgi:hypothetical protein